MIHTGLTCLVCGTEIVRGRRWNDSRDKVMYCSLSCSASSNNRGKDRSYVGPLGKRVIALAFNSGRITPKSTSEALGIPRRNACNVLRRMWQYGRLVRVDHGVYALPRIIEARP